MDVLTFLAAHPGHVVSQKELFDALWPDTVFSPGAIQRCIAQLRKAMGDNARSPIFISTHSKRGYCLDVMPSSNQTALTKGQIKKGSWLIISLLVVAWLFVDHQLAKRVTSTGELTATLTGKLTPITSTSHYDFFPTYSSDAKTLAFIRQQNGLAHIYLKDMASGAERQLTNQTHNVLSIVWSEDNNSIFFIVRDQNSGWVGNQAIDEVQARKVFMFEGAGDIWRLFPKDNSLYYMLAEASVNKKPITKIRSFDLETKIHTDILVNSDEFASYRIAISPDKKVFAIAGESAENKVEFRLFDLKGHKLSKSFATLPLGFTEINWHPDGKSLLVNHLARFSPNGESIAFVSSRTGKQQLYIWDKDHDINIFANPSNLPIRQAPVWSKKGDKLAFSFANNMFIYSLNTKSLSKILMSETFTSVLDWFVDGSRLLIATKKRNVSYFSEYNLDTQTTINLVETGVNYSARLSNTDELVFYKNEVLQWGVRKFVADELPEISGDVYPLENVLIFQSGRQVIRFDGKTYSVMVDELPEEASSIVDVQSDERLLLHSNSSRSAKIVALE